MLASDRHGEDGKLKGLLGAVVMGLIIYVDPEGTPSGEPETLKKQPSTFVRPLEPWR
jgi:catalase (peroxidase I)